MSKQEVHIDLEGGKYTYVFDGSRQYALRHGEEWRDLCGDKFVMSMAFDLDEARTAIASLQAEIADLKDKLDSPYCMLCGSCGVDDCCPDSICKTGMASASTEITRLKAEVERYEMDAKRYAWLRDGNAYAPEEESIRGGQELDELCDQALAPEPEKEI